MRLDKVFKLLQKEYPQITFELKNQTAEKIEIQADIVASNYFDDGILTRFVAYASGTVHVFFTFDKIDGTFEELALINDFNSNAAFLKAYVEEKKSGNTYLELHGVSISAQSEKDIVDVMCFFLGNLLSDSVLEYLKPLTNITRE